MDAGQPFGCLAAHRVGDGGAHVAALSDVAAVAEPVHQLGPGAARCGRASQPSSRRLAGEAVAGNGRQHEVERVLARPPCAVGSVSGPTASSSSMTEPGQPWVMISGNAFVVSRLDVDEVDVHPVDLGRELRKRVEPRLGLAPVVVGRPVAGELLHRRQLHALRPVVDELLAGPASRGDAPAQVVELLVRNLDVERANVGGGIGGAHSDLRWLVRAGAMTSSRVGGHHRQYSSRSRREQAATPDRYKDSEGVSCAACEPVFTSRYAPLTVR